MSKTTSPSPETVRRIRESLRDKPNQMTLQMAHDFGVPEVEILRAFPEGRAIELDIGRWEEIIRALARIAHRASFRAVNVF